MIRGKCCNPYMFYYFSSASLSFVYSRNSFFTIRARVISRLLDYLIKYNTWSNKFEFARFFKGSGSIELKDATHIRNLCEKFQWLHCIPRHYVQKWTPENLISIYLDEQIHFLRFNLLDHYQSFEFIPHHSFIDSIIIKGCFPLEYLFALYLMCLEVYFL